MGTPILDNKKVQQKIVRMAHQIAEQNFEEPEIIMIGIQEVGFSVASALKKSIELITKVRVNIYSMEVDKQNPLSAEIKLSPKLPDLTGKVVIIVDDVANTGKTMFYALKPILEYVPKKVQVAVLVDRLHKQFPIESDYVGMSLSTTMNETILVKYNKDVFSVYIS